MSILRKSSTVAALAVLAVSFTGCSQQQQAVSGVAKTATTSASSLYPPNAQPGHCYAKVLVPAQYKTVSEKVLARAASSKLNVVPAQYGYKTEKRMVSEATERLVTQQLTKL